MVLDLDAIVARNTLRRGCALAGWVDGFTIHPGMLENTGTLHVA